MKLPKFIYACQDGRHFIIHTGFPRFIGEAIKTDIGYMMETPNIIMIDDFPIKAGDEMFLAGLMREAGEFLSERIRE
jgi:hypothetical protein